MRVIQGIWGDVPDRIQLCLDSVRAVYPQVEVFRFQYSDVAIYESDKWRWLQMLENDNILYIDWDIEIGGAFEFEQNGLPSLMECRGQPDNCLMYSPDRAIFQAYEDERRQRGIAFERLAWYRRVMRNKPYNKIDGVNHLRTSGYCALKRCYRKVNKA